MRFSAIVALPAIFGALAVANETVSVKSLTIRNTNNTMQSASLTIEPAGVDCSAATAAELTEVNLCGTSAYRFYLEENALNNYNLTLYKQTGQSSGIFREQPVTLICRAGGAGTEDYVCEQRSDITYTLSPGGN